MAKVLIAFCLGAILHTCPDTSNNSRPRETFTQAQREIGWLRKQFAQRDKRADGLQKQLRAALVADDLFDSGILTPILQLLDLPHRLAGDASKGADLLLQGEPLGGEVPMLQGVGSATIGPISADAMAPNGRGSGTAARCASIWLGISTLGSYPRAWD